MKTISMNDDKVVLEMTWEEKANLSLAIIEFTQGAFAPDDEDLEMVMSGTTRDELLALVDSMPNRQSSPDN